MSIHEANARNSRAAEVADWLHSAIDIPGSSVHEESTQEIHFSIPSTLTDLMIKELYHKFFGPRVVSIGPRHHELPHVKPMEHFKRKAVRELAERVKDEVSIEQVYANVEEHLLKTRNCYSPRFKQMNDGMWCLMMFLDACFIIEFICNDNIITSGKRSWLNMKKHDRDLVRHDLLLYDNQLPYQVIDALARAFRCDEFTLHLLTIRFLQMPLLNISSAPTPMYLDYIKGVSCLQRQQGETQAPVHLLQYYKDLWISVLFGDDVEEEDNNNKEEEDHLAVCPPFTATELKKAGIRCICASDLSKGIRFESSILSGMLFLPKLTINEWTVYLFHNLVAYEYACSLQNRSQNRSFGISSYLNFMCMLINGEEDVKELRARGVIQINIAAGDDQLIKFLRDITAPTDSNPQAIRNVKRQISTYFRSKRFPLVVARAEMKQRYFSGPWSFLVFLAVIFTVGMTVIQTVLTAIQTYK
ncbi:hypothetical protein P3L10_014595 [Capsicum annuum]